MDGKTSLWNFLDVSEEDFFLNQKYESLIEVHHFLKDIVAFGWVPGLNILVAKDGQVVYQGSYGTVGAAFSVLLTKNDIQVIRRGLPFYDLSRLSSSKLSVHVN